MVRAEKFVSIFCIGRITPGIATVVMCGEKKIQKENPTVQENKIAQVIFIGSLQSGMFSANLMDANGM